MRSIKLISYSFAAILPLLSLDATAPALARGTDRESFGEPNEDAEISVARIAGPFEFPWSIGFLPNSSILVTERTGRLQLVGPDLIAREVGGVPPILSKDHGGLLDVAVDASFSKNRFIYLSYVHGTAAESVIRVLRAKLDDSNGALTEQQIIFESFPPIESAAHVAGRVVVTSEGYLFLTLGDRRKPELAQNPFNHVGAIIRIRTDGSIPDDNPFVSSRGGRPEIWTYGHRNPQGLALDPRTGNLWSHEHGPLGGDELNLVIGGRNYGWPVVTHGSDYSGKPIGEGITVKEGMESPVHHWTPAIAPSGLAVESYDGRLVLWIGALAGQAIIRLELVEGRVVQERRLFKEQFGRIRDVRIGPDRLIYMITDSIEGALYRLEPAVEQASGPGKRKPL